jgi:beta-glucanase (GH16 family)
MRTAPHGVLYVAIGAGLLQCAPIMAQAQAPVLPGWRLTWAEEFSGSGIDTSRWNAENIAWPYNNEQQFYLPQQATVGGGVLDIKAERRNHGGRAYVSARINTDGNFTQQYGRFEARMKVPAGQGLWPAFWLLPATGAWPPEIDIMETVGSQPTTVYLTHHWGTVSNVMSHGTTWSGPDFTADYHRFAVQWSGSRVDWLVDDVVRFTSTSNFPHEPMYIILNMAVGGFLPGPPNGTTPFPSSTLVDWVRVYQWDVPLANTGFENASGAAPSGWQVFGNAQRVTSPARTGSGSLRLSGIAGSGPYYSGAFQDLPASPGQQWSATAHVRHDAANRLTNGNFVDLKIEWFGPAGQPLGAVPVRAISDTSPTGAFISSTVQASAPPGTATARVALVFVQPTSGAGSAFIDDVQFTYSSPAAFNPCPPDFNGSGTITVQDIYDFLEAWNNGDSRSDFNGVDGLSVQDIYDFLQDFAIGC